MTSALLATVCQMVCRVKCLVVHDSATGVIAAIPCESKGDTRYLGIELMRFIQGLGHSSVTLKCGSEPSTLTLQRAIVAARQRLGLQTLVQNPSIGAKGSLGFCEKAIDSVRKLANTLLDQSPQPHRPPAAYNARSACVGICAQCMVAEPLQGDWQHDSLREGFRSALQRARRALRRASLLPA